MKRMVLVLGVMLVLAGVLWPSPDSTSEPPPVEPASLRYTTSGPVQGFLSGNNTFAWLGIPFAAPPEGDRRWRRPQLPEPWSAPLDALSHAQACIQLWSPIAGVEGGEGDVVGSEDCLYLNVYAPADLVPGESLPVMVWIHGGGNSIGSTHTYDGSNLARQERVVVVTLQYRLGLLGWFSHQALREAAPSPQDASGNFGTLDLVAGLRWVQNNIASFGGDPRLVTIFGESAGGRNVFSLMASPEAAGLFSRAIAQSGATGTTPLWRAENYSDDPEQPGVKLSSAEIVLKLLQTTGRAQGRSDAQLVVSEMSQADILNILREQPPGDLYADLPASNAMIPAPQLFRDGTVLPTQPIHDLLDEPGAYNSVPLMTGTNRDEAKLFMALNPEYVNFWFGLLPRIKDPDRYEWRNRYDSDVWKALAVDEVAIAISRGTGAGKAPVYAYRWDWDEGASSLLVDYATLFGAGHGLEIAFVFGDFDRSFVPGLYNEQGRRGREDLSAAMMSYWAQFARTGNPGRGSGEKLPRWQDWANSEGKFMLLDTEDGGGLRMSDRGVRAVDLKERLRTDPSLTDPQLRCAEYARLFLSDFSAGSFFDQQEFADLGCGGLDPRKLAEY